MAWVLHDGPDDGRAVVGAYTHFGFALLKDGVPQTHRDANITVTHNGVTLFSTQDAHDYDGVYSLDVVFPSEGAYEVRAESEGMMMGTFAGTVVAPVNETVATIVFEPAAPFLPTQRFIGGAISVVDANGSLLTHTDAAIDVRDASGKLLARTHGHIHDEPIAFTYLPPGLGDYFLEITAYKAFQTGRSADVRPVFLEVPIRVDGVLPDGASTPALMDADAAGALDPAGPSADGASFSVRGGYDPQPLVGVGHLARISAVAIDANESPLAHVDFSLRVTGPDGLLFESSTLHEYDGVFDFAFTPTVPGEYLAQLVTSRGDESLPLTFRLVAAPPVAPLDPGLFNIDLAGHEGATAGTPVELVFSISGATGPLPHSEVDVRVFRADEPATYAFKLHTHDTGETRATMLFPSEGTWTVAVDGVPLMPQASNVATPAYRTIEVAAGLLPAPIGALDADDTPEANVPDPALGLVVALVALAALATRSVAGKRQ